MQSQTTRERRKAKEAAPLQPLATSSAPQIATVRRRKWGTGPFDENWLNLDCCGLVCAAVTYALLLYGVFAVCFVLIPPWMSITTDNVRYMSLFGHLHRIAFVTIAALACSAHFRAMTTDPGSVPPDATPLPDPDEATQEEEGSDGVISPMQKGRRLCRRCRSFKPNRAHHCR
jgi:palmitoyltransferase